MTDRRYGVNQYGDGALYGTSDTRDDLAWDISIDWDGDDILEANETLYLTSVSIRRGRTRILKPVGEGFEPVETGKATVELRNDDGRFDAWNESSPLYPNVGYGKDIRIRVRDLNGSADPYPLFRGTITDIVPVGYGHIAKVIIHASDGLEFLRNDVARVAMQENVTVDEAIGLILDNMNWPGKWGRSLDVGSEQIRYWWSSGNKQAMSEIQDLATSFLGYFFTDGDGQARFIARTAVTSAVANFDQAEMLKDIGNPQPYDIRRSVVRMKVHPRTQAATGVIYQLLGNTPSVTPGAANALTIFANYTYSNTAVPAVNVISPVATTDFLVNTQSDGGGTDLTGSCTVTMTDFGDTAKLVITNNSASLGYVTFLRIRGDAIYEPNVSDVTYPSDISTVLQRREMVLDLLWQQDINVAIDIANVMGPFFGGLHPLPIISVESNPDLQFAPDLFDVVSVDIDEIGVSGYSFRVGGIEHETIDSENCQRVRSRFIMEPYIAGSDFMQWDTNAVWDTSTVFGW